MQCMSRSARLTAALVTLALMGCGDTGANSPNNANTANTTTDTDEAFCSAMEGVAARMARDTDTPTQPQALRVDFDEVVTLLDQAEEHAPEALSDDIATFAAAIDHYVVALADADYDLDVIFSTPEGTRLAEDTSHALTPDVINHMTGPCGITLE